MFVPFNLIMDILKTIYRDWEFKRIIIILSLPISVSLETEVRGDFLIIRPHGSFYKITMCVI